MVPVLLDTDILSEIFKLRNVEVARHALSYSRLVGPLTFSVLTRFEIVRGFRHRNATIQLARFEAFCQGAKVLPVSDEIWDRAASLWAEARRVGKLPSDADLLIAATALEYGRALVAGNTPHFDWIEGLELANWRIE